MTRLAPDTEVHLIGKRKAVLARGYVVEHTDDSDEFMANAQQWLTITIVESLDPRVKEGPLRLRRPARCDGEWGWESGQRAPKGANGKRPVLPGNLRVAEVVRS